MGGVDPARCQGRGRHNEDTGIKILCFAREAPDSRTGLFTTGIVTLYWGFRIALFFSGRRHAGENLADLLKQRAEEFRLFWRRSEKSFTMTPRLASIRCSPISGCASTSSTAVG